MTPSTTGPSPGARIYWTSWTSWLYMISIGIPAGLAVGIAHYRSDLSRIEPITLALAVAVAVLLGAILTSQLRYLRNAVAVDEQGLWNLAPGRPPVCLRWEDIASVEAQEGLQRLVVKDAAGTTAVRIGYQTSDFDALRDEIHERAKNLVPPRARVFVPSRTDLAIACLAWVGLPLAFAVACVFTQPSSGMLLGPLVLVGLIFWLRDATRRLEIRDRELLLGRGRSATVIPFAEIEDVEARTIAGPKASRLSQVMLHIKGRKPITLPALGSSERLYQAVHAAWLAQRRG